MMTLAQKSPSPIDKHVGNRVCLRRKTMSMSQTTLGNALGISFQQVQKYENGKNRIGAGRLAHIAHILQVSVAFFFKDLPTVSNARASKNGAASPDHVIDFVATSEGLTLAKAFMRITYIHLRRRIVDVVEEIADRGNEQASKAKLN